MVAQVRGNVLHTLKPVSTPLGLRKHPVIHSGVMRFATATLSEYNSNNAQRLMKNSWSWDNWIEEKRPSVRRWVRSIVKGGARLLLHLGGASVVVATPLMGGRFGVLFGTVFMLGAVLAAHEAIKASLQLARWWRMPTSPSVLLSARAFAEACVRGAEEGLPCQPGVARVMNEALRRLPTEGTVSQGSAYRLLSRMRCETLS